MGTVKELRIKFESSGNTCWINSDIYPDGKIYTKEYTEWLENLIINSPQGEAPSVTDNEGKEKHCGHYTKCALGYYCKKTRKDCDWYE